MKIGFARQSTTHQKFGLENQIELLNKEGCEKIFSEEVSALASKRPEFEKAIEFAREGDTFVVTTLSRFGRSLKNILDNVQKLEEKNVGFKILDLNIDTSSPSGKLTFNMFASIYQFERERSDKYQCFNNQTCLEERPPRRLPEVHRGWA